MYRIYWSLIIYINCCLIYAKEAKNKNHDKMFIAVNEFEFVFANKDLILMFNTSLPNKQQLCIEFMLKQTVNEFSMKFIFDIIKKDNRNMNLINYEMDGCKVLELAYSNIVAIKLIMTELLKTSNLPRKCPILAHQLYYVRNYTINAKDYPEIIPAMHWRLTIYFIVAKKQQGKLILKGEVRK